MSELRLNDVPQLRDPALIMAFAGWSDAGQAATGAAKHLVEVLGGERAGELDPEEFYNFTEQRPLVKLRDGNLREVEWPENAVYVIRDHGDRDFVVWVGVEPHLRWRHFTDLVVEMIQQLGIKLVVSLGGLLADVPHTRPVRVTGTSTDELLMRRMHGWVRTGSRYEGPTGILGILGDRFRRENFATATLWANVPHYIGTPQNPLATTAMVERLSAVFALDISLGELADAGRRFEREVGEAVAGDSDITAYVRQLEERLDDEVAQEEQPSLPSSDALVKDLEEFFRRGRSGNPDEPSA